MKKVNKLNKKKVITTWLLSVAALFAVTIANAQSLEIVHYYQLEQLQDENMEYLPQIYDIVEDYPAFSYNYEMKKGKVKKVNVYGVDNNMDRKKLEVVLLELDNNKNKMKNQQNRIGVFYSVEKEAVPKVGKKEFRRNLQKEIEFPENAEEWGIDGEVYVQFVVDENGEIPFIKATANSESEQEHLVQNLKKEAIQAVKETSGSWEPATIDGVEVPSLAVVPVVFDFRKHPSIPAFIY